jgi:glycine dehydrogenase subunit 1
MLAVIGAPSLDGLFAHIPESLRLNRGLDLPAGKTEADTVREMERIMGGGRPPRLSFAGAGAYEHYLPAAAREIVGRGEFLTAYTPYQAEASQGSLQAFFEYQTLICQLTGLDVANASLYEAGSALAEAVIMAHRVTGKPRVLLAPGINPLYLGVVETYTRFLGLTLERMPEKDGVTDAETLSSGTDVCAVVVQHPNFYGALEPVDRIAGMARNAGALTVGHVNPVSLGLLKPPGEWGADIAVGDIQPLAAPLSFGGPYAGFMACRRDLVRRMPGRIVGMTMDAQGRRGFVLTLQTREQHIRREKATSNICSNQALVALQFTAVVAMLGASGLVRMAGTCARLAHAAARELTAVPGVNLVYGSPFFHEFVVRLPRPAAKVCAEMTVRAGIVPGVPLSRLVAGRENDLLVCVTETKNRSDVSELARELTATLALPGRNT